MPLIKNSSYCPPRLFRDGHLQTMYPFAFRMVPGVRYRRERISTPDGDFLDLDWCDALTKHGRKRRKDEHVDNLVVVSHGLEASTRWSYIRGMVRAFIRNGFDALAWNYRGCSGEDNRAFGSYHAGAIYDLERVLEHAESTGSYKNIVLIGFSLGANLTLKFLSEYGSEVDPRFKRAVVFSAPVDLESCTRVLALPSNKLYMKKFLRGLRGKVKAKQKRFPGRIDARALKKMKSFQEFDDFYTAPAHGFRNAEDYWRSCSSIRGLKRIRIPTLLVSAKDDPFLAPECYPYGEALDHEHFFFEAPDYGGHVGFVAFNDRGLYWSERRALDFVFRVQ